MNIFARIITGKGRIGSFLLLSVLSQAYSQQHNRIVIGVELDSAVWDTVAYLSIIPDFNKLSTVSSDLIIEQSCNYKSGIFEFNTATLPEEEHLYRVHFLKRGDPPASLIIGGQEHNHFFLFAARNSRISVKVKSNRRIFDKVYFEGYSTNKDLQFLNTLIRKLDSLDQIANTVNQKYAIVSIYDAVKMFADTCSFPLLSLYSLYNIDYGEDCGKDPDYYRKFLRDRRKQKSLYFEEFRKVIGVETRSFRISDLKYFAIILVFIPLVILYIRNKKSIVRNYAAELTIQERKILILLKQGKSNKEIADEFSISISTVKSHLSSIYSKLDINSRREVLNLDS